MALRKRKKAKTKLTFAVTIPQPDGVSIKQTRELLLDALNQAHSKAFLSDGRLDAKIHLLNKETTYA